MSIKIPVVVVVAALVLAGCSQHTSTIQAISSPSPSTPATAPAATPAPTPTPGKQLTRKQAAAAYVRIVHPANRAGDIASQDYTDRAPWTQFVADARATLAADRKIDRQLAAVHWPASVQPYITAMITTYDAASERCTQAEIRSGSYSGVDGVDAANADCLAAQDSTLPDTIRQRLGLPPRS